MEGTVEKDDEEISEIPITPIERLKERIRAVLAPQKISSVLNYNKQNVPREIDKVSVVCEDSVVKKVSQPW